VYLMKDEHYKAKMGMIFKKVALPKRITEMIASVDQAKEEKEVDQEEVYHFNQ
jgi:hypothetical protein